VSDAGYKYFLIPQGQADVIYYERQVERRSTDLGFDIMRSKYVPRTLNISQAAFEELGLNVIEVSNIDEALPYFFEG
jgi:predicted S18 family serine protease